MSTSPSPAATHASHAAGAAREEEMPRRSEAAEPVTAPPAVAKASPDAEDAGSPSAPSGAPPSAPSGAPNPTMAGTEESAADAAARERDHYRDALQRLTAEFQNFRRRTERERDSDRNKTVAQVVRHLLPALDALDAAVQRHRDALEPLQRLIITALEELDVQRVQPDVGSAFDPTLQEAIQAPDDDDGGPLVVAQVLRTGYQCAAQLIRPATVIVQPGPPQPQTQPSGAEPGGAQSKVEGKE